jgi:hypothetical protein
MSLVHTHTHSVAPMRPNFTFRGVWLQLPTRLPNALPPAWGMELPTRLPNALPLYAMGLAGAHVGTNCPY